MSIREKYHIPADGTILLYVGNISDNKNQRQMADVFGLLPDVLQNNTWVLFCGRSSYDGSFELYVREKSYSEHLVLCGVVNKTDMPEYYHEADGVVLLSYAEGFGLSLVEGMHFGVPCAMFKDMDAFEDIYDEKSVVAIENRRNETVAKGIADLILRDWNKEEIVKLSERFESGAMANKYKLVYQKLIS